MTSNLAYIGNQTTFYPYDFRGQVNVVSEKKAIAARILHVLLTRPGEDPIHPDWGIAPDLFQPHTQSAAITFAYQAQEILVRLNELGKIGFEALQVKVNDTGALSGKINIEVYFRPTRAAENNVLTFGYWEYQQVDNNIEAFLNTVDLI